MQTGRKLLKPRYPGGHVIFLALALASGTSRVPALTSLTRTTCRPRQPHRQIAALGVMSSFLLRCGRARLIRVRLMGCTSDSFWSAAPVLGAV